MITRKEFLGTLIKGSAVAAGAAALLSACGDDGGGGGTADAPAGGGNCTANGTSVNIQGNHGHTMTVSQADISAGTAKTYEIMGSSGHPHSVTLTAAHFQMLASNQMVSVTSGSGGGHTHTVVVRCA